MGSIRLADLNIDEKVPLDLLPKQKAPNNDLGILKKMVDVISCKTPANYGYNQTSKRLEFDVGTNNAENHNDSYVKLTFEVENMGASEYAFLDGHLISFFNRAQLKQKGGAEIEDLEQVNRKVLSDHIQTTSVENAKFHFDSWKHNLIEDDPDAENAAVKTFGYTAATNNLKKKLVQGTSYVGILPVSDVFNFFKGNSLWHSYRGGQLEYKLICEEDAFIFSSSSVADSVCRLKITEAKFHLINYDIDPVVREEVLALKQVVYPFETYKLKSVLLQGGAQTITWSVGDDYLVGLKLVGRRAAAGAIGELHATTAGSSVYKRDLTRAEDLKITSLQIKCGSERLAENPITSKAELYNLTKQYYNQQQDTDIGSMIDQYNWDSELVALTEDEQYYFSTDAQHINIPLNINGKLTGWDSRSNDLEINITSGVTASQVYLDIYCISSKVGVEEFGKVVVYH